MSALAGQIADAVTAELNATAWPQSFTAVRKYRAKYALTELAALKVAVLLGPANFDLLDRRRDDTRYATDVVILRKIDPASNAQVDPLVELMEALKDHFRGKTLTAGTRRIHCAQRQFVAPGETLVDDEHLADARTFVGAVRLQWRTLQ